MARNLMKTFVARADDIKQNWYVVDASDLILGRMAVVIADYLRGKNRVYFTPNRDCGSHIIVVNAEKVVLTGDKEMKRFYWHTGHIGGIKFKTMGQFRAEKPERIIENSVRRMIARNSLGRTVMKKLHVYAGNSHPHGGQNPIELDLRSMSRKNFKN
ncbi:MAG: 50S ribosomal protein L13 [Rickettsiales bacterium]|jgi:large subunit ribosomal protein L13|nr:50S ribosomal protein L13 [Rickettsiales bacterium]